MDGVLEDCLDLEDSSRTNVVALALVLNILYSNTRTHPCLNKANVHVCSIAQCHSG